MKVIITPRGRKMSPAQYIALVHAQLVRDASIDCVNGHVSCAAWLGGPCSDELDHELEGNGRYAKEQPKAKCEPLKPCCQKVVDAHAALTTPEVRSRPGIALYCPECKSRIELTPLKEV